MNRQQTRKEPMLSATAGEALPTSISSLHFPIASHSLSLTLTSLHQAAQSTHNRLTSIRHDSIFVKRIGSKLGLPLIANERCGGWYIPPQSKAGSVYFKSTDGHFGEWAFSKRRLNLQLLEIIGKHQGCIIVDSTRRGKSMPDALAKTVPIWCAVLNRLLFGDDLAGHELHTPNDVVGASEQVQINARLDGFLEDAKDLQLNLAFLRDNLRTPLRPFWVTPDSTFDFEIPSRDLNSGFYPVVCCTASRRATGNEEADNGYIQGAGDDSESWSHGLTAAVFWRHEQQLLSTSDEELSELVQELMGAEEKTKSEEEDVISILPLGNIYLSTLEAATRAGNFDGIIVCSEGNATIEDEGERPKQSKLLSLKCGSGKLGSRALRAELSRVPPFISALTSRSPKILFACPTGKDLSVGVALVVLCLFFNDKYALNPSISLSTIDKSYIRRRLAWITSAKPDANPSRSTLQAVNSFLIERPV